LKGITPVEHDNNDHNDLPDDESDIHSKNRNNNTLKEGTSAFMHWLNSEDKKSLSEDNPIVLLKFINDRHITLHDTNLRTELDVEINNGVPYCKYCKQDDCSHVGFTIEVEQLFGHSPSGHEETIDDIVS